MRKILALAAVGMIVSACSTVDNLKPAARGEFLALNDVAYEKVWQAANTVMARRFRIIESDSEIGTVKGLTGVKQHDWDIFLWRQSVALFVWPTESNSFGYTIDIDSMPGPPLSVVDGLSISVDPYVKTNWRAILLEDLKKELGAS